MSILMDAKLSQGSPRIDSKQSCYQASVTGKGKVLSCGESSLVLCFSEVLWACLIMCSKNCNTLLRMLLCWTMCLTPSHIVSTSIPRVGGCCYTWEETRNSRGWGVLLRTTWLSLSENFRWSDPDLRRKLSSWPPIVDAPESRGSHHVISTRMLTVANVSSLLGTVLRAGHAAVSGKTQVLLSKAQRRDTSTTREQCAGRPQGWGGCCRF
jgi:hypothetical protein